MKTVLTTFALALMLVSVHPAPAAASWWPWKHHHSCGCEQAPKCGCQAEAKCGCKAYTKCNACEKCAPKVAACAPPPPVEKCHYVTDIVCDECGNKVKTKHVECVTVQPKAKCTKCGEA